MNPFQAIAETNQWGAIWPEIALGGLALLLLVKDLFMPSKKINSTAFLAIAGQLVILAMLFITKPLSETGVSFGGMIFHTPLGHIMRVFFLVSSLIVTYIGILYFRKQQLPRVEFFHISLVATAASMLLVQSHNFVMLFVALETVTVSAFILVSYCRTSVFSLEAGLKYLILGALSSSLLLFGVVLLYGAAGNASLPGATSDAMNFTALANFIGQNSSNGLVQIGTILVICGIAFKIGVVPFQIWIPDVYQGAPTPVTAFLAVASKAAGFIVLINLVRGPFAGMVELLGPLLSAIAIVTILFGNISAISQSNVKRLMGLSGISHAGYLLVGVIASYTVSWAVSAVVFYLFTYLIGSFAVFCVMGHMAGEDDADQDLAQYENFAKQNPFLGGVLAIGLGSLTGIPPLVGFIGKLLIFIAAFEAKLYLLLGVSIVGVVISIYYYFGWIRDAFFYVFKGSDASAEAGGTVVRMSVVHYIVLGLLALVAVYFGIYQGVLSRFIF